MKNGNTEDKFIEQGEQVLIKVKFLKPNTVLNCPTFDTHGNIVHPAYTPFSQSDIDNLIDAGVEEVFYSKSKSIDHQPLYDANLKDYLNQNIYDGPRSISIDTQIKAVNVAEKIEQAIKNNSEIDFEGANSVIDNILDDLKNSQQEVINLLDIQSFDDFTYSHCLNVGVIAMAFARKIGFEENDIKEIGIAGFLHDIGKIRLPYDLIHKASTLNPKEFETVKKHSRYSYEIIKDSKGLPESVKKIVLLHHERFDGSGYPFGFKDQQIDDGVYIVAIAEFYDALTTKLSYKEALGSKEALKNIIKNAGTHFKPDIAHRFSKNMGILFKESNFYHLGSAVLLNTNEIAIVVSKDSETTSRPGVEIIKNEKGQVLQKPIFVDLTKDGSRYIIRLINH